MEIITLALHIFLYFASKAVNAELGGFLAVEPVTGGLFGNVSDLGQRIDNIVFPECEGFTGGAPVFGINGQERILKSIQLTLNLCS